MTHPLKETYRWFQLAVPNPTERNQTVQLGVHFEEIQEMLGQLDSTDAHTADLISNAYNAMGELANDLKQNAPDVLITDPVEFLDSVADQIVTATGSAYMQGMDPVGALCAVNISNFSKFDENGLPIFDENGKVKKGPNYHEPDLQSFV